MARVTLRLEFAGLGGPGLQLQVTTRLNYLMIEELAWLEAEEDSEDVQIEEYDLTSSPNDFNVLTISSFIESGAVKIPGFQRNYVWDIKRASKLIESLIIGLPVPQIFLYEESRNRFLVIDGQQRLMSIFYFIKQRFPRKDKRGELRRVFDENGHIPDAVLEDDHYFERFTLRLPEVAQGKPNKFTGRVYGSLDEHKTQFDLRTIRNVIVKQNVPKDDDSSIYEMFNRLNTGGINLTPQEIRASLYHSPFYDMLSRVNVEPEWRRLLGQPEPEVHMRDTEVLLRAFAMAIRGSNYGSSMAKFLNAFSKQAKSYDEAAVERLMRVFCSFLKAAANLSDGAFYGKTGKFSVTTFEAVFAAAVGPSLESEAASVLPIRPEVLTELKRDADFLRFSVAQTSNKANVAGRLRRAGDFFVHDYDHGR